MNGYIVFHNGKPTDVYADTLYRARLEYEKTHRVKKSDRIYVELAELDSKPVLHVATN